MQGKVSRIFPMRRVLKDHWESLISGLILIWFLEMSEGIDIYSDFISFREYLEGEKVAEFRHEYADGKVFAMAGASEGHEIVAGGIFSAIYQHLKGSGCRAFKGDMKLKVSVQKRDLAYYPDIMVACDSADNHPMFKERPKLLIEVMSDYKADHLEKLFAYQQIESLEQYLVVSQDAEKQEAWLYERSGGWQQTEGAPDGVIKLTCIDFSISLSELYL